MRATIVLNARQLARAAVQGFASIAVFATILTSTASAQQPDEALADEVEAAIIEWIAAVASGDPDTIAEYLAPEYQLQRANGDGFDRESYLTISFPIIEGRPMIDQLVVTADGDLAVARYVLTIDETIDGMQVNPISPRLTVLRRDGDDWLIVAHANFSNPN